LIRAYCKYLLQTGIPFSQAYMEQTMVNNAPLVARLVELFEARLDPARGRTRTEENDWLVTEIFAALDNVSSLDDDRILRAFLHLIRATLRTNYYQPGADGTPKD